jgi:hypothetical protein
MERAVFARTGMTIIDIWALLTQVNAHSDLRDLMAHHERVFERDFARAWRNRSVWPCRLFIRY